MPELDATRARIGAISPHAPLLVLDDARSGPEGAVERVRAASRECARSLEGPLVVVSPHARETGVYVSTRGGLRAFGVPRADAPYAIDLELSTRVASAWGRPALEEPLDHGITVPLRLLDWTEPVVAVGLGERERDIDAAAASLADVLRTVQGSVVASVNGGAGVTARGPLTKLPQGRALENALLWALQKDVASLETLGPRLASEAGSCGLGPLLVLARLFPGASMEVLAHEWPFGVGYPVAITRPA